MTPLRFAAWVFFSVIVMAMPAQGIEIADKIYHGGPIITVDSRLPDAEALAVKDGKIVAVGRRADVLRTKGESTRMVDLEGKTLVPGFVDGHSHFISSLQVASQANCFPPPRGPCKSISDIIKSLRELQQKQGIAKGEFVIGYGYDGDSLTDNRGLTAADLDAAFPDNPVVIQHFSMHSGVCNSRALQMFGINRDTPTPKGGVILRKPGTNEPAGPLMETAWAIAVSQLPSQDREKALSLFPDAQMIYASAGVTTAQEGASQPADIELLDEAARRKLLSIDVVAYPFVTGAKDVFQKHPPESFGKYVDRLKLGGIKITMDGSPQLRTAYFTTPYLTGGPAGEANWHGEPSFPRAEAEMLVKMVYDRNLQLLAHCNGDAAIDLLLECHEKVAADRFADRRTVVIHSQFVRPDQLLKYQDYKFIASFFTEHCFYLSETHSRNRGAAQTASISPMKSALELGIRCANHTDFSVMPIDQMLVVWTAVNRVSAKGEVIGPNERVTPLEALHAITLGAAQIYREEHIKGSLSVGKLADLVILDRNPLTVAPLTIKDIRVMETIKEGKTIYQRK